MLRLEVIVHDKYASDDFRQFAMQNFAFHASRTEPG